MNGYLTAVEVGSAGCSWCQAGLSFAKVPKPAWNEQGPCTGLAALAALADQFWRVSLTFVFRMLVNPSSRAFHTLQEESCKASSKLIKHLLSWLLQRP